MKHTIQFNSWAEFIHKVKHGKRTNENSPNNSSLKTDRSSSWCEASSMPEALEFLDNGWQAGIDRIKSTQLPEGMCEAVMPVKDYKLELQHTIAGGIVDVGSYLTGSTPDNFLAERHNTDEIRKGRKIITIYFQTGNNAGTTPDTFFYQGVGLFKVVEHLEECGYGVEVIVVFGCRRGDAESNTYVPIKTFDELFDYNKLAVSLCSAFFFRRFIFAVWEMEPRHIMQAFDWGGWSYGTSWRPKKEEVILPVHKDETPLVICLKEGNQSKDSIIQQYQQILNDYKQYL